MALVLVVALMGQAAKPGVYALFFGNGEEAEYDDDFADPQTRLVDVEADDANVTAKSQITTLEISTELVAQARTIVQLLSPIERSQWTTMLSRWKQRREFSLMRPVAQELVDTIAACDDLEPKQRQSFYQSTSQFAQQFATSEMRTSRNDPSESPDETRKDGTSASLTDEQTRCMLALLAALDAEAFERVVDGAALQSADVDAFFRQLDLSTTLSSKGAARTSIVPLLQQPEVYRGQLIRISGKVGLVEKIEAGDNPYGFEKYLNAWVIPDTGSDRPFLIVTTDLPTKLVQQVQAGGRPEAKFVGRFFKRIPYRSKMGPDVAPLVIGRLVQRRQVTQTSVAAVSEAKSISRQNTRQFLFVSLGAGIVGFVIAALVMWRTSLAAKRSREIRAAGQDAELSFDQIDPLNKALEES